MRGDLGHQSFAQQWVPNSWAALQRFSAAQLKFGLYCS